MYSTILSVHEFYLLGPIVDVNYFFIDMCGVSTRYCSFYLMFCVVFITMMFIERSSGVMSSTLCVFRHWIITVNLIFNTFKRLLFSLYCLR